MRSPLFLLATFSLCFAAASAQDFPPIVAEKCAGCHPVPRPASMPRHAWPRIGATMTDIMGKLNFPIDQTQMSKIIDFYVANSPVELDLIPDDFAEPILRFEKESCGFVPEERPQVTGVTLADISGDGLENDLIVTDNNLGAVTWLRFDEGEAREKILARVPAPVNVDTLDFDGDGDTDLAVSAMGYMHPTEELIGEFHLLLNDGDGSFEQKILLEDVPRITDSAAGDFDGDGDTDFILAMFGWRFTGAIGFLEQTSPGDFELHNILEINGCMQVELNDSNGDDLPDFIALLTQQHESIVQFVNKGDGKFSSHYITRANHPAFGSSSIHLKDLNQDGHVDILFTNGDMMDENPQAKPYHGARWLENDGLGNYSLHYLVGMPGCYDAEAVDLDGDGDLDVVVSSLNFLWDQHDFPSLAWLENTGGFRNFVRRRIAYTPTNLAKIAIGDLDGNGKPDIIGGGMHVPGPIDRKGRLTAWFQR